MNIQAIYDHYRIMPILQLHMRRTAAVVKLITDHLDMPDMAKLDMYRAMLLHDIGNIVKFNLSLYPEYSEPEGDAYWHQVQQETIARYGATSWEATSAIVVELGVSKRVTELIASVGFVKAKPDLASHDLAKMICCYADQRVEIDRVTDLRTRLAEGRKRFLANREVAYDIGLKEGAEALLKIETAIIRKCGFDPTSVNDETVDRLLATKILETIEF